MANITSVTKKIAVDGKTPVRVTWSPSAGGGTYEVIIELGSHRNVNRTTGTSYSFIIPTNWLYAVPANEKSLAGTVTVREYRVNSNTPSSVVTVQFEAVIPMSVGQPTLKSGWMTLSADGFSACYLQSYSRVKGTVDESKIITKFNATIADIRLMVQGKALPSPYISDLLKEVGTVEIEGYVTDSRGFTTRVPVESITVLPYTAPALNNVVLLRSLNNGAPVDGVNGDISGAYLYAKATAVVSAAVGLRSLVLLYRMRGTTSYTSTSLTNGSGKAVSISELRAYDAVITATDGLGNTCSVSAIIPHESRTFRIKDGGKAVGIGTAPGDDETVRLGWKLILEEGLESHVPLTPVGGCVILASGIDPADEFGGSWEQVTWSGAPSGVKLWKRTA
jgi:hypothetical protein